MIPAAGFTPALQYDPRDLYSERSRGISDFLLERV